MRKITCYIFILTLLIGIFSPLSFVNGQEAPMPTDPNTPESTISAAGDLKVVVTNPPQIQSKDACGFVCWGILMAINGLLSQVMTWASLFLWLSGTLLDYILVYTIVNFAKNIQGMTGIQTAWVVVRDLMNLGFVFLLLYQGIRMILGRSNNAKQVIFGIVLASILINFSMFMTKVIIDASNVMTLGFYNAIVETSHQEKIQNSLTNSVILGTTGTSLQTGISGAYVDSLGVHRFYDKGELLKIPNTNKQESILIITVAATIIFVMVAVIFFAVAIMFLVRYVILIVLLMFSPIAVMGIAIPAVKSAQEQWWKTLMGQAIFAPLYMIMTWVILTLINSQGFNPLARDGAGSWADLLINGKIDNIGLIINFIIIIVLTIMSLSISKKYATEGSTKIGEWTNKVTTFAGGAVMGGAAVAGRNTIGAGADRLAQSKGFQEWAGRSAFGQRVLNASRGVASGSFDVRRSKIGESVAKTTGVDLGKGIPWNENAGEGGYSKTLKTKIDKQESFGKSLRTDDAKEAYAQRLSDKALVRGGSNSSWNTVFGVMGRSNRIVASKILNDQIKPLADNEDKLQNRENQLSQQIANMTNEITNLNAMNGGTGPTPGTAQATRLADLNDFALKPVPAGAPPGTLPEPANRNSVAYAQYHLNNTQTQLSGISTELTRLRGLVDSSGLKNTNPKNGIVNRVTGKVTQPRADEQNY